MSLSSAPLGEVLDRVIDHRGRTPKKLGGDFSAEGVPVISAKNIKDGRVVGDVRFVTEEMYGRWMPEPLRVDDVLLTSEAPLGELTLVRTSEPLCLGQRLFALRARAEVLEPRFLYYLLRSPVTQQRIRARASGTTAQGIRQSELMKVVLDFPSLSAQRAAVRVLSAFDEKRELDLSTADTLGRLVALTYRHVASTEARVQLRDIADVHRDTVEPSATPADSFEHFSIPAFDSERLPETVAGESIRSGKTVIPANGALLVSKLNPHTPRSWWARPSGAGVAVGSTEFVTLTPKAGVPLAFLHSVVRFDATFRAYLVSHVTGTTGSHQRVRPADMLKAPVPQLSAAVEGWSEQATALLEREAELIEEVRVLRNLTSHLLPRLVRGDPVLTPEPAPA